MVKNRDQKQCEQKHRPKKAAKLLSKLRKVNC